MHTVCIQSIVIVIFPFIFCFLLSDTESMDVVIPKLSDFEVQIRYNKKQIIEITVISSNHLQISNSRHLTFINQIENYLACVLKIQIRLQSKNFLKTFNISL